MKLHCAIAVGLLVLALISLSGCNSGRVAELETENQNLRYQLAQRDQDIGNANLKLSRIHGYAIDLHKTAEHLATNLSYQDTKDPKLIAVGANDPKVILGWIQIDADMFGMTVDDLLKEFPTQNAKP